MSTTMTLEPQTHSRDARPARAPAPPATLTWSLVVCTYRREQVLPRCVRCALTSTRPPKQVIVVDASPDWDVTRAKILGEFEAAHPTVEFLYHKARRASLTAQRNQALELTTADVAFMLDDDSLIFPDTAEKIMAVYDADTAGEIVALTPLFVAEVPDAHLGVTSKGHPTAGSTPKNEWGGGNPLRRIARTLLWSDTQLMPYDGDGTARPVPPALKATFELWPAKFSTGSATFRTAAVRNARFEELLERYAAAEDWDISERIRHKGLIAYVPAARQCHLEAPGGRLSRRTVATLKFCNFMALHVLHSTDVRRSRRLHKQFVIRRLIADVLADLAKLRFDFGRTRGTLRAAKLLPVIFGKTPAELRAWYPQFQRDIIATDTGEQKR